MFRLPAALRRLRGIKSQHPSAQTKADTLTSLFSSQEVNSWMGLSHGADTHCRLELLHYPHRSLWTQGSCSQNQDVSSDHKLMSSSDGVGIINKLIHFINKATLPGINPSYIGDSEKIPKVTAQTFVISVACKCVLSVDVWSSDLSSHQTRPLAPDGSCSWCEPSTHAGFWHLVFCMPCARAQTLEEQRWSRPDLACWHAF